MTSRSAPRESREVRILRLLAGVAEERERFARAVVRSIETKMRSATAKPAQIPVGRVLAASIFGLRLDSSRQETPAEQSTSLYGRYFFGAVNLSSIKNSSRRARSRSLPICPSTSSAFLPEWTF